MGIDFGKVFRASVRFPLKKDVFLTLFAVQIFFSIITWYLMGYFGVSNLDGSVPLVGNFVTFLIYFLPVVVVSVLVSVFISPAYIDNASQFFVGKKKAIAASLDVSKKRFLPLLAVLVILGLIFLACIGVPVLIFLTSFQSQQYGLMLAGIVWMLVGLVVGVILAFMTMLTPIICVLEKKSPLASLKLSWNLVGKNKVNTVIYLIIFWVIYFAIAVIGSSPDIAYTYLAGDSSALSVEGFVLLVIRTAVNTYLALFLFAAFVGYFLGLKKKA